MGAVAAAGAASAARFTIQTKELVNQKKVAKKIRAEIIRRKGSFEELPFMQWPNDQGKSQQVLKATTVEVLQVPASLEALKNKDELIEKMIANGIKLMGIHPLTQIVFLAQEPSPNPKKSLLQALMNSAFKTKIYIASLGLSLENAENLLLLIPAFAQAVKKEEKTTDLSLAAFNNRWENFLQLLC